LGTKCDAFGVVGCDSRCDAIKNIQRAIKLRSGLRLLR
jgi:hypothetical protein